MENKKFQILSLEGGGMKGIFSAAILAAIESDLNIQIVDHFDLVTGTSTGGIIALGLGFGLSPEQILEFYLNEGKQIFPPNPIRSAQHWLYRKYSSKPLEDVLKKYFKNKLFGESKKRLVIPSYNLTDDDIYLFRTPHAERLKRDYKVPAWKVGLATTAAPTYFSCSRHIDKQRLIDGGVWANNPTMVGVIEAYGTLGVPLSEIKVLSIGTTDPISNRRKRLNNGGIIAWGLETAAIDVILRGQSLAAHKSASYLLGKENVERLNPHVTENEFNLDGINKADDLIAKAAHHSRHAMPTIETKFMNHRAEDYHPLHSIKSEELC